MSDAGGPSWATRTREAGWRVREDGDGVRIHSQQAQVSLDLSDAPDGVLRIVDGGPTATNATIRGAAGRTLTIQTQDALHMTFEDSGGTVLVTGANRHPHVIRGPVAHIAAQDGQVRLEHAVVDVLDLDGAGRVQFGEEVSVDRALLGAECNGDVPKLACRVIVPAGGTNLLTTLHVVPTGGRLVLDGDLRIANRAKAHVRRIGGDGRVVLGGTDAELVVDHMRGDVLVTGTGSVRIRQGRASEGTLVLDPGPVLHVGRSASVQVRGVVTAGGCAKASINAPPGETFTFDGLTDRGSLEHATLVDVVVHELPHGRERLRELAQADVVELDVSGLSVPSMGWTWRHRWEQDRHLRSEVTSAAQFAGEVAGLVATKSALGSTRTKASWAAYRGRHLVASSWWERRALDAFRLVGYGQRPGPAFATWLIAALVVSVPLMGIDPGAWDGGKVLSWATVGDWVGQVLGLVLAPLTLLRLVGDPSLHNDPSPAELLAVALRSAVAAPFILGAVALARFLRVDWPGLGG